MCLYVESEELIESVIDLVGWEVLKSDLAIMNAGVGRGGRVAMVDIDRDALEKTAAEVRQAGGKDCVTTIVADATR